MPPYIKTDTAIINLANVIALQVDRRPAEGEGVYSLGAGGNVLYTGTKETCLEVMAWVWARLAMGDDFIQMDEFERDRA